MSTVDAPDRLKRRMRYPRRGVNSRGTVFRLRAVAISLVIAAVLSIAATAPASCDDLVQETQYLRVNIGGKDVRLEALFAKRADAKGRLPIAFFHHGRPDSIGMTLDQSLTATDPGINLIADIARRGWLVVAIHRRGYGLSDGPAQTDSPCAVNMAMSWMDADADDIQASIAVVAKRPDADPTRMITIGTSAGGAASVALGARNPPGLVAAIDIAGGEHLSGCAAISESVPVDFKNLGSRSRIPNLWIFTKNDLNHPTDQIEVMRTAFSGAGANLELVMLDPIGDNGHEGIGSIQGRTQWLVAFDNFLRAHNLPTWPLSSVDAALQRLQWPGSSRAYVQAYLAAPSEKALARTPGQQNAAYRVGATLDQARKLALDACQQKGQHCVIAMEDDRWVASK
jgi:pimeloyl-ACP methyl ester carboxylesterase